jgi:hypothetical protein
LAFFNPILIRDLFGAAALDATPQVELKSPVFAGLEFIFAIVANID